MVFVSAEICLVAILVDGADADKREDWFHTMALADFGLLVLAHLGLLAFVRTRLLPYRQIMVNQWSSTLSLPHGEVVESQPSDNWSAFEAAADSRMGTERSVGTP